MISFQDGIFKIEGNNNGYYFRLTKFNHLEHLYYGEKLLDLNAQALAVKRSAGIGSCVAYDVSDPLYVLDNMTLEYSGVGSGDYRETPCEIKQPSGVFSCDFIYKSHEIVKGHLNMNTLPNSYGDELDCETLVINLIEAVEKVELTMYYTIYKTSDVIVRRVVLKNNDQRPLVIRKLSSLMLDMPYQEDMVLYTLDGGWIKESKLNARSIQYGTYVNSSTTGASSNRHNPGFIIAKRETTQSYGEAYGFNLVYSGNHYSSIERSNHDLLRINMGINPYCFEWVLNESESFETPEAILTYSNQGLATLSNNFHNFINKHIVRGPWKDKERPILLNSWEAFQFRFNKAKLLKLAKIGKQVGVELFVLDDGWFSRRNDDKAGLGDYNVNTKKLRGGLESLSKKIHNLDMMFGLWFEPEMINEDSDLYLKHPEYAVKIKGRRACLGRNQLVLDLCNPKVRDYIVENVSEIIDRANVDYVKWDMNRHISDAFSEYCLAGEFYHRYIMGLYEVLSRIFSKREHVLLETCSSGGNRFDLGMLCFSPQIWASDNTDPISRLTIQEGLSSLYPLSTIGAHVSEAPHQQTLRNTPLSTRFNVASFGCLGYELDMRYLTKLEKQEVKDQITFYKEHRRVLQYGQFIKHDNLKDNKVLWQCNDDKLAISGFFQTLATASEGYDRLVVKNLIKSSKYVVKSKAQNLYIKRFGGLVKFLVPFSINPEGWLLSFVNKHYCLSDCAEEYVVSGDLLRKGILLNNQFMGSYYNKDTRILGDFGSNLYITRRVEE